MEDLTKRVELLETYAKQAFSFAITQNIENPSCFEQLLLFASQMDVETISKLNIDHRMWECITFHDPSLMRILLQGRPIENLYGPEGGTIWYALVNEICHSFHEKKILLLIDRFKELVAGVEDSSELQEYISNRKILNKDEHGKMQVRALKLLHTHLKNKK